MLTASRPLVADSVENEFVYVCIYVCVCVLSVRACMQAFAPLAGLFLTSQLRASNRPYEAILLDALTYGPTQSISHLRQRGM